MKIYKLEAGNADGNIDENGYYIKKENAEKAKNEMDEYPENIKWGIKQHIIEIETED